MKILKFVLTICLLGFFCCVTPKGVFYRGFELSRSAVISVDEFKPYGNYSSSGEMIRDLIIQHLLRRNFIVKDAKAEDVEYVLVGAVIKFQPEKKYLVYMGEEDKQIVVGNTLTEISGSYVYKISSAFGLKNAEVIATNSTVGVSAKLIEKKTGKILWSSSFTYEALTIETAADVVANYLVTSLTGKK